MRKFTQRFLAAASFALVSGSAFNANAQTIFLEDFQGVAPGSFAAGWALFNVDGLTPATAVSYVTDAWIVREDFLTGSTTDSSAFSTSWYTPAGTANDWMISPAITVTAGAKLKWRAIAPDPSYPDGYEVRVGTAQTTAACSTVVFTVAAETNTWVYHEIDLDSAGFTSGNIHIAFRNNNNDMFLLAVDDIEVFVPASGDAEVVSVTPPNPEYTIIPVGQDMSLVMEADVKNSGSTVLNNVSLTVNVYDGTATLVNTGSSLAVATLAVGATNTMNAGTWMPTLPDFYIFEYIVTHSVADGDPSNDTLYAGILIDDSTFARDDGTVTGTLGIGGGTTGFLGQEFTLAQPAYVTSIGVFYGNPFPGDQACVHVFNMAGGTPSTIIASCDTIVWGPTDSAGYYILDIATPTGDFFLAPGTYAFEVEEFDSNAAVGQTQNIHTPGSSWVDFPGSPLGGWAHNEDFSPAFAKPYVIRPHFLDGPVSVSDASRGNMMLEVTPNPTDGPVVINVTLVNAGELNLEIFDVHGKVVFSAKEAADSKFTVTLDASNFSAGTYFVKAASGDHTRLTKLVVR